MSFKSAMRKRLRDNSAILAIVGDRVYTGKAPQGTSEIFIVLNDVTAYDMMNHLGGTNNIEHNRWQIDVYGLDDSACETLKVLIKKRFNLVNHENWSDGTNNYKVYLSKLDSSEDSTEEKDDGGQVDYFRKRIDIIIKRSLETI